MRRATDDKDIVTFVVRERASRSRGEWVDTLADQFCGGHSSRPVEWMRCAPIRRARHDLDEAHNELTTNDPCDVCNCGVTKTTKCVITWPSMPFIRRGRTWKAALWNSDQLHSVFAVGDYRVREARWHAKWTKSVPGMNIWGHLVWGKFRVALVAQISAKSPQNSYIIWRLTLLCVLSTVTFSCNK